MSEHPPPQQETTLIHEKIVPEKVEDQHAKNQSQQKKPELQKRNQSDVQSSLIKSQSDDSLKGKVDLGDSIIDQQKQQKPALEQKPKIPDDFFYADNHKQEIHEESPIPECVVSLDGFFGHDSFKRYNAHILDRDTIIIASGISYTIYNHFTKDKKMLFSKDKGGIAAIAVHPTKKYFAVAEKGLNPRIYIYEYPSLKLYRIIRKGTQKSYSTICFSHNGQMLASVGSDPDYMLNVWDWKQQLTILKSKAFSQEVYKVSFSRFNEHWLTTGGTGHIRFWKIAETFTGLKLKGEIAKFGLIQLSDVTSFAEFEDGKVLSSSQYGKLLLWEGNMIKSVIGIDPETPCHKGAIEYVKLLDKKVVTAGQDGYIRFWDFDTINIGQSDEQFNFYLKPQREIYFQSPLGSAAHLNWIEMGDTFWIVQDALGTLYKYYDSDAKKEVIMNFNSGKFNDFATSPLNNSVVTTGSDGFVRLWDYGNKREFYSRSFATRAQSNCVQWFPFAKKHNARLIVVGFSDGIVRFLLLNDKSFILLKAFKVHRNSIVKVKANREGNVLAVADSAGSIFFISVSNTNLLDIKPFCLFETGFKINDMNWDRKGDKILLACQDGKLHEITAPKQSECDFTETYLKPHSLRSFTIKMMESQKPDKADLELQILLKRTKGASVDDIILDQQWQPAPILNAIYFDTNCEKVLCSVDGKFLGNYYIVDFNKERPIGSITAPANKTSSMSLIESQDLLLIGFRNGTWEVRHKLNPSLYLSKRCFDQDYGIVRKIGVNVQNSVIIALSNDGTMITHKFDLPSFIKGVRGDSIEPDSVAIPSVVLGISDATFADKIDIGEQVERDITDNSIYCLQDQKLKAEQDMKLSEAEKIKRKKLKKIKQLQELFKQIIDTNNKETDYLAKLTPEELVVDPQYAQAFQKRIDEEEQETRKQLAWDQQFAEVAKRKLEKYFVKELQTRKFKVKGIKTSTLVSSFKLKKLSPYIQAEIDQIEKIIEQEKMIEARQLKNKTQSNFAQSKAVMMEMSKMKDGKKGGKQENQEVRNKIKEAEAEFQKQLAHAIATKGDYKLKTSRDYIIPENQRLNVSRKKKHLFLHYQYLHMEKLDFNNKLKALKEKKTQMAENVKSFNQKIRSINKLLGQKEEDFAIEIDPRVETMEFDITVSEQDIQDHLIQKQKEKQASKKTGGMGMGGGNQPTEEKKGPEKEVHKVQKKQEKKEQRDSLIIRPRANARVKKSPLEDEIMEIRKIKLKAERDKLKQDLADEIASFDQELEQLRVAKYHLQSDLNLVEMKILTFSQELIIFRDMQVYDNKLMQALTSHANEKLSLEETFINLTGQINELQTVTEQVRKKYEDEKKILKEFVYPEDEEMRERIIKYYKIRQRKRINKLKKQAEMQEKAAKESEDQNSNQQQEQEIEEDQEESEQEDQFEDDQQKPDITIIENDHKNFERVRKICEYDQKIQQNSRRKSELQKQRTQITTKIKTITAELSKAQTELLAFQKKKLLKVNQLFVSYPIKFSQIQFNVNIKGKARLHEQLTDSILFTKNTFIRLGDRIEELKREKVDIEKKQKNLNKKLAKLTESVHKSSIEIESKKKEYEQKQLLKFGSTFQLERLKQLQPSNQVIQMRELFKKQERQVSNKIEGIKRDLQNKKRELLQSKRQNTKVITEITQLGDRQNDLKKKLDSTNKQLFKNYDVSKKDQLEKEKQNLKDLIKFLSKEIEDLKTQIGLFKRKGGHIYTMVTSNKKNFS